MLKDLKYKNQIFQHSQRLVEAQRPVRILDAIKWEEETERFFIQSQFKEMPKIDDAYYAQNALKYDPAKKIEEFQAIAKGIAKDLGEHDPLGAIMLRHCREYQDVVRMLTQRGKKSFYDYSKKLYGSALDRILITDRDVSLHELATEMKVLLAGLDKRPGPTLDREGMMPEVLFSSTDVVKMLQERLNHYFRDEDQVNVKLSDGIVSDASAGADYIKIKRGRRFSLQDVHTFEVHEGWVHLGTTFNGSKQPYAKWLAKGSPSSTVTQEGLAIFMELLNFALHPWRAQKLHDRVIACQMAEAGANVLEVMAFYKNRGQSDEEVVKNAGRIFRGAHLHGGAPFTKDISYLKGLGQIYDFLHRSIAAREIEKIPFLFSGKVALEDIVALFQFHQAGVIAYPSYIPPPFCHLHGLAVWMAIMPLFQVQKQTMAPEDFGERDDVVRKAA